MPALDGALTEKAVAVDPTVATTEREVVRRARSGDLRAFEQLVERYKRRAYYAALSLVGSHEDAMDLSQEAFARAFRARRRLDPGRPFYAWLYRILRNLCFNFLRDSRTRRQLLTGATPWIVADARDRAAEVSPAKQAERAELRERVRRALETLPEFERETLVLREFEGLSYREIAELLDIPIGTVMSRLYAARRRLAERVEETT